MLIRQSKHRLSPFGILLWRNLTCRRDSYRRRTSPMPAQTTLKLRVSFPTGLPNTCGGGWGRGGIHPDKTIPILSYRASMRDQRLRERILCLAVYRHPCPPSETAAMAIPSLPRRTSDHRIVRTRCSRPHFLAAADWPEPALALPAPAEAPVLEAGLAVWRSAADCARAANPPEDMLPLPLAWYLVSKGRGWHWGTESGQGSPGWTESWRSQAWSCCCPWSCWAMLVVVELLGRCCC